MKHLFSPYPIKGHTLKNRIVMPALASFLFHEDGSVTDEAIEHYRLRASAGMSMMIVEAATVSPEGIVSPHQARIFDDRFIGELSKIADVIKSEGIIAGIQLHHSGRQTSPRVIKGNPVAPSPLPCPTIKGKVHPLTVAEISQIVVKFGDAAERAIAAGFDLIEIHGAHGYLINQFLSRFSNIREDGYGGNIEGRTRFAKEVVQEIRKRVGNDIPISFKISAQEFVPNGLDINESIEILKILIDAGIDIVQVSAGNDATPEWICQPMYMKKACLAGSAYKIKQAVDITVMAVGRINDPVIAENIIADGKADLVCMGRGILADPAMPRKAKEGRFDEIRKCIACNTCMESIFRSGRIECLVNPVLGREKEMAIHSAVSPKKIMVVGGGPAGLNVAWVAAKRGHNVILFEKNSVLGGQLVIGSMSVYKREIRNLIEFQKRQVKRYGVECRMSHDVTLDDVLAEKPDVIVLATGSKPVLPSVTGINNRIVTVAVDVLADDSPKRLSTVVVGGGSTGCEAALYLAEIGCPVTIVEEMPKLARTLESITRKVLMGKLKEYGVDIKTGYKLTEIKEDGILLRSERDIFFIEAQRVVMATGNIPNTELYNQLKNIDADVHLIGDCLEVRNAKAAIYEGYVLGISV
ncbi:MAG: FAD-dependent oxidoreductase [Deltaproteobacteria bacterium]|nr:FAD-dependent oxidoreductase [Deltaproteobacteria bacterium]